MTLHVVSIEPSPLELDPRPCGLCGLTIDCHQMVDDGERPIFYCVEIDPENLSLIELERRAELIRQLEVAAIFARLEAADDPSKRPPLALRAESYRPAQSTIDAFRLLIKTGDAARARAWLADRPKDAPYLLLLLEG